MTRQPCHHCHGAGFVVLTTGTRDARQTRTEDCRACDGEGQVYRCDCGVLLTVEQRRAIGELCPVCRGLDRLREQSEAARTLELVAKGIRLAALRTSVAQTRIAEVLA